MERLQQPGQLLVPHAGAPAAVAIVGGGEIGAMRTHFVEARAAGLLKPELYRAGHGEIPVQPVPGREAFDVGRGHCRGAPRGHVPPPILRGIEIPIPKRHAVNRVGDRIRGQRKLVHPQHGLARAGFEGFVDDARCGEIVAANLKGEGWRGHTGQHGGVRILRQRPMSARQDASGDRRQVDPVPIPARVAAIGRRRLVEP